MFEHIVRHSLQTPELGNQLLVRGRRRRNPPLSQLRCAHPRNGERCRHRLPPPAQFARQFERNSRSHAVPEECKGIPRPRLDRVGKQPHHRGHALDRFLRSARFTAGEPHGANRNPFQRSLPRQKRGRASTGVRETEQPQTSPRSGLDPREPLVRRNGTLAQPQREQFPLLCRQPIERRSLHRRLGFPLRTARDCTQVGFKRPARLPDRRTRAQSGATDSRFPASGPGPSPAVAAPRATARRPEAERRRRAPCSGRARAGTGGSGSPAVCTGIPSFASGKPPRFAAITGIPRSIASSTIRDLASAQTLGTSSTRVTRRISSISSAAASSVTFGTARASPRDRPPSLPTSARRRTGRPACSRQASEKRRFP